MPQPEKIPEAWLWCRLRQWKSDFHLSISDASGESNTSYLQLAPLSSSFRFSAAVLAAQVASWLQESIFLMVDRNAPKAGRNARGELLSLPIFFDVNSRLRSIPWEFLLRRERNPWNDITPPPIFIRCGNRERETWPPLHLPVKIHAIGKKAYEAFEAFRSRQWMNEAVQRHAFQGSSASEEEFEASSRLDAEIILCPIHALNRLLRTCRDLPTPPRLVIALAPFPAPAGLFSIRPSAGISVAVVTAEDAGLQTALVAQILEEFSHNLPIHAALQAATQRVAQGRAIGGEVDFWLFSTPEGNQALRLEHAAQDFRQRIREKHYPWITGNAAPVLNLLTSPESSNLKPKLEDVFKTAGEYQRLVSQANDAILFFTHESRGIQPMAEAEDNLARADVFRNQLEVGVQNILSDPAHAKAIEATQERVVNVSLDDLKDGYNAESLGPSSVLNHSQRCRLDVHIGTRSPQTLLAKTPPPIDALLPVLSEEVDGWDLDVVVFPKTFTLQSPPLQKLRLPRVGGTRTVSFFVTTPANENAAELRVELYYGNQLLQSFTLTASLGQAGIEVVCDFSQTFTFKNLDSLSPRDLCLGLNDDQLAGSHRLQLKKDGVVQDISLDEKLLSDLTQQFRDLLGGSVQMANGSPWFPAYNARPNGADQKFEEVIRALAQLGSKIHTGLFNQFVNLGDPLRELARSEGLTFTIARKNSAHAYPWPIIYDYEFPPSVAGAAPLSVCRGVKPDGQTRCDCQRETATGICLNGFWGIRHQIEQLVGMQNVFRNTPPVLQRLANTPEVMLAVDQEDGDTGKLRMALKSRLGANLAEYAAADPNLTDLLWKEPGRPSILICCGHLAVAAVTGQPTGARFRLPPGTRWLLPDELTKKTFNLQEWKEPKTLILLMACTGIATEIGSLNDFAQAFCRSGATGMVGSEIVIFSGLAARAADELTKQLAAGGSMGSVFRNFIRTLAREGNPLGLGLTYLGSADLKMQ